MSDCVAIAPELPFRQQIAEALQHAARSMPQAEQLAAREMMSSFDQQLNAAGAEITPETKRDMVRKVVNAYVETKGALDSSKDGEAESCALLLQHVMADNFDASSADYTELVKSVVEAVRVGGEAALQAGKAGKVESAERILNNTYNFLPPTSPLRAPVLLALLQLLAAADDLSALPLSPSALSTAASAWDISDADKVGILTQAAEVYESAGDLEHALQLTLLALERGVYEARAEKALALALALPNRFDLDDLLKVPGASGALGGKAAELVQLFTAADELEAVGQAAEWVKANGAYVDGLGVNGLDADEVLRKVRLVALTTLAARSSSKQIPYADIAKALQIGEDEVEAWVIDAIRANLLTARLSQPLSAVRIVSVSSRGTRRFGSSEWQLLERRLGEWKAAVADARATVEDAENVAQSQAQPNAGFQRRRREEEQ